MSRSAVRPTLVVVALMGMAWPVTARAQSREIRLPPLEVPDEVAKARRALQGGDRSALLGQSIELSDERDRRTLAKERTAWGRLSGSLCSGCGETPHTRQAATVDPIAVLNAKRVSTLVEAKTSAASRLATAAAIKPTVAPLPGAVRDAKPAAILVTAAPATAPVTPPSTAARPVAAGPTAQSIRRKLAHTTRTVRPSHAHRVRLAHRHRHRSKLASYLGKIRYTLLRWRHQRPHHHRIRH